MSAEGQVEATRPYPAASTATNGEELDNSGKIGTNAETTTEGTEPKQQIEPNSETGSKVASEQVQAELQSAAGEAQSKDLDKAPANPNTRETRNRTRDDTFRNGRGRGGGFKKRENKSKADFGALPESSDPVEIRKQVEFYFSDSNLLMDKFLLSQVDGHNNKPVPLELICSFKRMRHFQPRSAVIEAMKESQVLDLVDGDTALKRKVPVAEDLKDKSHIEISKHYESAAMQRSVYVKGFGEEQPSTQFDLEAFFAKFGPTNVVRLRRTDEKLFKGSVFVEFDSEETAKAFLALEPKPTYNGKDLLIKSKKVYCDEKLADIQTGKLKAKPSRGYQNSRQSGQRRNNDENGVDRDDWKTRRSEEQKRGFRDDRRGGRGRGDRGGGRGGGRGRGGRDKPYDRDSRRPTDRNDEAKDEKMDDGPTTGPTPAGQNLAESTAVPESKQEGDAKDAGAESKKRAREGDEIEGTNVAKKVDTKSDS